MQALSLEEARSRLAGLPGWQIEAGELVRTFQFKDFVAALHFVNQVGEAAEAADTPGHRYPLQPRAPRTRHA